MKTNTQIFTGIIFIMLLIGFLGYQIINNQKGLSTLNSEGTSELTVAPDLAKVYVGISILKPKAADAQNEANLVMTNIIKSLNQKGITNADIETDSLSVYEDFSYSDKGQKSIGFRATQTIKIKSKDLSKIGEIVDISISNGANQINNIEFYLSEAKEKEYKNKAIEQATKNAKEKAEIMAASSGAKLSKLKSISESNFNYMPYAYQMKNNIGSASIAESANILPQNVKVTANINLVYEIA
jgi:uncharacterized protein YggE